MFYISNFGGESPAFGLYYRTKYLSTKKPIQPTVVITFQVHAYLKLHRRFSRKKYCIKNYESTFSIYFYKGINPFHLLSWSSTIPCIIDCSFHSNRKTRNKYSVSFLSIYANPKSYINQKSVLNKIHFVSMLQIWNSTIKYKELPNLKITTHNRLIVLETLEYSIMKDTFMCSRGIYWVTLMPVKYRIWNFIC